MSKTCSVEGCNRKHKALGYCEKHYRQIKKYGEIRTKEDFKRIRIEKAKKDMINKKFGRLVVKDYAYTKNRTNYWLCECECGNFTTVTTECLNNGNTRSCGCYNKEITSKRSKTHGKSKDRLYSIYHGMINRCYNPNATFYEYYGGKGITICDEWLNKENGFMNFYNWAIENGYKNNLTIDRININGNYEPSNCRWVDYKKQANNKSNNHLVTINGETKTIREWCEIAQVSFSTFVERIKRNWDENKLLLPNKYIINSNNTSGYRNVSFDKRKNKWVVQLQVNGKNTLLGCFDNVHEAGAFAEKMRQKYYGEYAGKG